MEKKIITSIAKFATDTSTMCIFDLQCLKHRLNDDADWWSVPEDELAEVNKGNVLFFGLGSDGLYEVTVTESELISALEANLNAPSGKVFIGAGEEVTSAGLEPQLSFGGIYLNVDPGAYRVKIARDENSLLLSFTKATSYINNRTDLLRMV